MVTPISQSKRQIFSFGLALKRPFPLNANPYGTRRREDGCVEASTGPRRLTLTLIGVGAGLISAYGLTRLMASLLYGVTATDYLTFVSVSGVLIAVGLAASFLPAWRATKVNPTIALRAE